MRGTDPTKSKWECPIMLYVCSLDYGCITKYNFKCNYLFVIVGSVAIFYLIHVQMYKPHGVVMFNYCLSVSLTVLIYLALFT